MKKRNQGKIILIFTLLGLLLGNSCSLFMEESKSNIDIEEINISDEPIYITVGQSIIVDVEITPNNFEEKATIECTVDGVVDVILEANSLQITGVEIGSTLVKIKSKNDLAFTSVNVISDKSITPSVYLTSSDQIIHITDLKPIPLNVNLIGQTSAVGYTWTISDTTIASLTSNINYAELKPLKEGMVEVEITHPSAKFAYKILVIVDPYNALDPVYFKNIPNIITLYTDNKSKEITINTSKDTSTDLSLIDFNIKDPTIASLTFNNNTFILTPKNKGITEIVISHPNILNTSKILVNIISRDIFSYIYSNKDYIELKGQRENITASIKGGNYLPEFSWVSKDPTIARVIGHGSKAVIEGGFKEGETEIVISNSNISNSKVIYVNNMTSIKTALIPDQNLTANTSFIKLNVNTTKPFYLQHYEENIVRSIFNPIGSINTEMECIISDPEIASIEETTEIGSYKIKGLNVGTTEIIFNHKLSNKKYTLKVSVYGENINVESITDPYLTMREINIYFDKTTMFKDLRILPKGDFGTLTQYAKDPYSFITWETNSDIIEIIPNGQTARIIPKKIGECWVNIKHPESINEIKLFISVKGLPQEVNIPFITTNDNIVNIIAGGTSKDVVIKGSNISNINDFNYEFNGINSASIKKINNILHITGISPGSNKILVTHPKAFYPLEILVNVYASGDMPTNTSYITTNNNIVTLIKNKENPIIKVKLTPTNNNKDFEWINNNPEIFDLITTSDTAELTFKNAGTGKIEITHPDATNKLTIIVKSYNVTEEGLIVDENANVINPNIATEGDTEGDTITPYLYTSQNIIQIHEKDSINLDINTFGINDKSAIMWTLLDTNLVHIINNNESGTLTGLGKGETKLIITHPKAPYPLEILIKIYAENEIIPKLKYITSTFNVVTMNKIGDTKNVNVSLISSSITDKYKLKWENLTPDIIDIVSNRETATIKSKAFGEGSIKISHPDFEQDFIIKILVVDLNKITKDSFPYIKLNKEKLNLNLNDNGTIEASLINNNDPNENNYFNWINNNSEISILQTGNTVHINSLDKSGIFYLEITHPLSTITKEIPIIVASETPDDLANQNLIGLKYITVPKDIIFLNNKNGLKIEPKLVRGSESDNLLEFNWTISDNNNIVNIVKSSKSCYITPLKSGQIELEITHPKSIYSKKINIFISLKESPLEQIIFIKNNTQFVNIVEGSTSNKIVVDLYGGTETDSNNFIWKIEDSDIATISYNNGVANIKGLKLGSTRIIISHPKALYNSYINVNVSKKPLGASMVLSSSETLIDLPLSENSKHVEVQLSESSTTDLDSIKWSIENPNIVSIISNRDSAYIKPLKPGITNIIISHPLAKNTVTLIVSVSEYFDMSFSKSTLTLKEGETTFLQLNYPQTTSMPPKLSFTSSNSNVAKAWGTTSEVEIVAEHRGSTTITAESSSGHKATLLLRVNPKTEGDSKVLYLTSNKKTEIYEEYQKNVQATARLIGGSVPEQREITWSSSDNSIVRIVGGVGESVFLDIGHQGKATVTIHHEKSDSNYTINIEVEGNNYPMILDNYYQQVKESKNIEIEATLDKAPPSAYEDIRWTSSDPEKLQIIGKDYGKLVNVRGNYGGIYKLTATTPWGEKRECDVEVVPNPYVYFNASSQTVAPGKSKTISYSFNPPYLEPTFTITNSSIASYSVNRDNKTITIYGHDNGNAVLAGMIDSKTTELNIKIKDSFSVSTNQGKITGNPRKLSFTYDTYPLASMVDVISSDDKVFTVSNNPVTKTVTITGVGPGKAHITLKNNDAYAVVDVNFTLPPLVVDLVMDNSYTNPARQYKATKNGSILTVPAKSETYYKVVPNTDFYDINVVAVSKIAQSTGYKDVLVSNASKKVIDADCIRMGHDTIIEYRKTPIISCSKINVYNNSMNYISIAAMAHSYEYANDYIDYDYFRSPVFINDNSYSHTVNNDCKIRVDYKIGSSNIINSAYYSINAIYTSRN